MLQVWCFFSLIILIQLFGKFYLFASSFSSTIYSFTPFVSQQIQQLHDVIQTLQSEVALLSEHLNYAFREVSVC